MHLTNIITWIRDFSNSDTGILIGFISLVSWAFGLAVFIFKKVKLYLNTATDWAVFLLLLSPGLIPVITLVFSHWAGFLPILLNCLSLVGVSVSGILVYDLKKRSSPAVKEDLPHHVEQFELRPGESHKFFGELVIYLVRESFRNLQTGHVVTAKVWAHNYKEKEMKNKTVGCSMVYACGNLYLVRIIKAGPGKVLFEVAKLPHGKA
jgi:hypothetical protein